jgi:anti-sigma regulatory factor (Ser/Thr protein kinase)
MNRTVEPARPERTRSRELKEQSELLSQRLIDNLRRIEQPAVGENGDTFVLRLARLRPAVGLARHSLGRWLERRQVPAEHIAELTLAASEACANAVEHPVLATDDAFEIEASHRDREVRIVVRDSGRWRTGPVSETRGRGMQMIRSLMDEVDLVQGEHGTELVMRRRLG